MKGQGIDSKGWLFLTGSPANIERVLAAFQLRRKRDADGSVEHITGVFILDPNGHELHEYDGEIVKPAPVISDLQQVLARGPGGPSEGAQEANLWWQRGMRRER